MPDQTCDNLRSMSAFGQLRTIVDFGPAVCPLMTQSGQWRLQFILPDLDGGCHKARPNGTLHIRHIKLWLKDINAQPRSKLNLVMQRSIFARTDPPPIAVMLPRCASPARLGAAWRQSLAWVDGGRRIIRPTARVTPQHTADIASKSGGRKPALEMPSRASIFIQLWLHNAPQCFVP